ncbi:erythromycin esterase family protein [Sphingomonas sp. Y38-1Y]|uniref:erythromycin esterase family protein n=1 Tax=Sphingomonas sp. Y38-1Y TaxID=3078265 RepID=UPI0028EA2311|nr:erythromycin esterase family protein [Sphingomonas sp. Y38-1Y]
MIGWMAAAWVLAGPQAAVPSPAERAQEQGAASAWIASDGRRFEPGMPTEADLAPLVTRLKGTKVIGIGEATHGTHEDQAFKAELVKALVRAGAIDAVAIECNRTAGRGFDRYVTLGEGDPAALIRAPGFFSIWRNDEFGGLLLWLRAWNQRADKPIRMFGIDVQESGTDAAFALRVLGRRDRGKAEALRKRLAPILPGADGKTPFLYDWVKTADAATMTALLAAAADLENAFGEAPAGARADPDVDEARFAARAASQGLVAFEFDRAGVDRKTIPVEYWGRRDRSMARNLIDRVGGGRAAFWAQNGHVLWSLPQWEPQGYVSTGIVLRRELGRAYQAVGFTWSRAVVRAVRLTDGKPDPKPAERRFSDLPLVNDRPGDMGAAFTPARGDALWIDMAKRPRGAAIDRWAARPTWWGVIGWGVDPATFQTDAEPDNPPDAGYDIVVWHRKMTPSRTWPGAMSGS